MLRQYTSGQPPSMPKMIKLHGSVLFADVSGFTQLTEKLLNDEGPSKVPTNVYSVHLGESPGF